MRTRLLRGHRLATMAAATAFLAMGLGGCGGDEASDATKPTYNDTIRAVAAADDAAFTITKDKPTAKFLTLSQAEPHTYVCADGTTCKPAEGYAEQTVSVQGVTRGQLVRFYLDNLGTEGWIPAELACDPASDSFVLLARRTEQREKKYPERFELLVRDDIRTRLTVPADGADGQFKIKPDDAGYPTGTCPAELLSVLKTKQDAAAQPKGKGGAGSTSTTAPTSTSTP